MVDDWKPSHELASFINLDHDRVNRRGYGEAVYSQGKTPSQLAAIAGSVRERHAPTIFTRVSSEQAEAIIGELSDACYDTEARVIAWPPTPPPAAGGMITILSAGTSDLAVAREAAMTATYLGRHCEMVVDVGVAGLHRVLGHLDLLRRSRAIIVVAGMDGALASVVAGLVSAPVVAVPTSVGYGAAFGGLAPLLSMLNACVPGVAVVNIDNGYGAGHLAAQIVAP